MDIGSAPHGTSNVEFPDPLLSIDRLSQEIRAQFDGLTNVEKGDRFAAFVQKLIPQTDIGKNFGIPEISLKRSNDGGVDLTAKGRDGVSVLYIQSKLFLDRAEDLDGVLSKFQSFHAIHHGSDQGQTKLFDDDDITAHYALATLSPLNGVVDSYKKRQYSSRPFYDILEQQQRIGMVDGNEALKTLRGAFRKTNEIPSNLTINLERPATQVGNVYLGIVAGAELRRLYGEFGDALFFENIRDFLGVSRERSGRTTPNQEIIKTIRETPGKMLERNNGIVVRAEAITQSVSPSGLILTRASIVNGCQTTMCIVEYGDQNCLVPIKIVQTAESWDIAKAANYQNSVEFIDLELARGLRPQLAQRAASFSGVRLVEEGDSILQLLDPIYARQITYTETRLLYIGLFSRTPNNLYSGNYTELMRPLVDKFVDDSTYEDAVFGTLFELQAAAQEGLAIARERFNNPQYAEKVKRFYKEDNATYRCFVTILALCGCLNVDVSDRQSSVDVEYERMMRFFNTGREVLLQQKALFVRYFVLSVMVWMQDVISSEIDDSAIQRDIHIQSRRAVFSNLFRKLCIQADIDDALAALKTDRQPTP
jgi:hypothetical protein